MQRFLFMVSIIVTMLTAGSAAGAQEAGDLSGRLSATLDSLRMRHGLPGATATIVLPDGTMAEAALVDVVIDRR